MKTIIKHSLKLFAVFLIATLAVLFQSCKEDGDPEPPSDESNVKLGSTDLGNILVDAEGNTLYLFTNDFNGISNCADGCLTNWPVFHVSSVMPGDGLNASDFGTITRDDGDQQTTYKGWPLYYFSGDSAPGDTNGENVGGVWFVLTPSTDAAPEEEIPTVLVADHESFGNILTDGNGNTLYFFTLDADGSRNCEGGCLGAWPIFNAGELVFAEGSTLDADDFGSIGEGENTQTTYKGWPLYYYASDGEAGEVNGDGVNDVWYVAKPDYSLMIADAQLVGNNGTNYTSSYEEGDGMTKYFTDADGRTLYIFMEDSENTNTFTNEDFSNDDFWPIFHVEIDNLPSAMNAEDFGEITVHGRLQLTFKGWPVYYFGQDEDRGDNKGVSVPSPGDWPIINNDTEAP